MPTSDSSFFHLGIVPKMLELLKRLKFVSPTPIQHKAIPIAAEGKDIFGVAQTGTGKTLAFGIPTIQRLSAMGHGQALIVVPTRELAQQVEEALTPLLQTFTMRSVVLIGGMPIYRQKRRMLKKPRVIIATPGRLIDHLAQGNLHLKEVEILVLDEADRMFDMGFQPQIEEILRQMKKKRQTLLFSATMPENIVALATKHMKLPIRIEITPPGTSVEQITQELFIVKEEKKKLLLKALLKEYPGPVLVFVGMKVIAKRLKNTISEMGYKVAEIHSNRTMGQRKHALEGFKSGKFQVLVATDVAARGIDVSNIELVINYDLPEDVESYVHRIGRTGRAGANGHAVSFAKPNQGFFVGKIERLIRKTLPVGRREDISEYDFDPNAPRDSRRGNRGRRSFGNKRSGNKGFKKRSDGKGSKQDFKKKNFGKKKSEKDETSKKDFKKKDFKERNSEKRNFEKKGSFKKGFERKKFEKSEAPEKEFKKKSFRKKDSLKKDLEKKGFKKKKNTKKKSNAKPKLKNPFFAKKSKKS